MPEKLQHGMIAQRMAIWLIAIGTMPVSVMSMVQELMNACQINGSRFSNLAFSGIVPLLATRLFVGAGKMRAGSIWPALALFLPIVQINSYRLGDSIVNPQLPGGGFAAGEEVAERGTQCLKVVLKSAEAGFYGYLREKQAATAFIPALIGSPQSPCFGFGCNSKSNCYGP